MTKLEFSTDQSNYLNKSDQVYKDNVAYQSLFGGEAMITLVTMDPGHTVAELFTADGIKQWTQVAAKIRALGPGAQRRDAAHRAAVERQPRERARAATSPRASRARSSPATSPARSRRRGRPRAPRPRSRRSRASTRSRSPQRTLDNPKYIDFLLYDNPQPKQPEADPHARCCRSSPTRATRRWSCASSATSRSRRKARPPTS